MKKFVLFLVCVLFLTGCKTNISNNNNIQIVTSIYPLYEFTKEIVQDKADVYMLLPPGVEAHSFELSPSDIINISKADVFVYIGAGLEPWAHDVLEGIENNELLAVEAVKHLKLMQAEEEHEQGHEHSGFNPHVWLDFGNDFKIIDTILDALIQKDSLNAAFYQKNAEIYKSKLNNLDKKYSNSLKNCSKNTFITGGHDAYSYLVNRYGLKYISVYNLSPDSEPTPKHVQKIIDLAKKYDVKFILAEDMLSPRMAQAIAEEAGLEILPFNPGANLTKTDQKEGLGFIGLMYENLESLKKALECNE